MQRLMMLSAEGHRELLAEFKPGNSQTAQAEKDQSENACSGSQSKLVREPLRNAARRTLWRAAFRNNATVLLICPTRQAVPNADRGQLLCMGLFSIFGTLERATSNVRRVMGGRYPFLAAGQSPTDHAAARCATGGAHAAGASIDLSA